jgi:hypothetical protein
MNLDESLDATNDLITLGDQRKIDLFVPFVVQIKCVGVCLNYSHVMHWEIYFENKSSKQYWGHKRNQISKLLVVWGVCLFVSP